MLPHTFESYRDIDSGDGTLRKPAREPIELPISSCHCSANEQIIKQTLVLLMLALTLIRDSHLLAPDEINWNLLIGKTRADYNLSISDKIRLIRLRHLCKRKSFRAGP